MDGETFNTVGIFSLLSNDDPLQASIKNQMKVAYKRKFYLWQLSAENLKTLGAKYGWSTSFGINFIPLGNGATLHSVGAELPHQPARRHRHFCGRAEESIDENDKRRVYYECRKTRANAVFKKQWKNKLQAFPDREIFSPRIKAVTDTIRMTATDFPGEGIVIMS
ncbi:hypothetical protein V2G26_000646 [Clonostachys chloroleuca]